MGLIDSTLLSLLDDTSNKRVVFQQEWRDAPSMTMASLSFEEASFVDSFARLSLPLSPIETEFAVCDSQTINGVQQSILPNADGKWTPIRQQVFPFIDDSDEELLINRVSGELYNLRITPDAGAGISSTNEFALSFGVKNLHLGFGLSGFSEELNSADGYFVTYPNFSVSCTAQITTEVAANVEPEFVTCGEQNVHCVPGTIQMTLDNPAGNVPPPVVPVVWLASTVAARPVLMGFLEGGVRLHFENFAATSLGFGPLGDLKLSGASSVVDGGSMCSPMPVAPPPLPPTRGLVRVMSHDGHGEIQSTDGYVREYPIAPHLAADFVSSSGEAKTLVSNARLWPTGNFEAYAAEFPPSAQFDVSQLVARLWAERGKSGCWQKRAVLSDILFFGDLTPVFGRFGQDLLGKSELGKLGFREFRALEIHESNPDDVRLAGC